MSPASPFAKPAPGGNESTSVDWSLERKRRFSERSSALPVTSTLTVPLSLLARLARTTNLASAASLNPITGLRRITNVYFHCALCGALCVSCGSGFLRPVIKNRRAISSALPFNLTRSTRWFLLPRYRRVKSVPRRSAPALSRPHWLYHSAWHPAEAVAPRLSPYAHRRPG
jgi:hypothetical protein